jgi:hypothetical protein
MSFFEAFCFMSSAILGFAPIMIYESIKTKLKSKTVPTNPSKWPMFVIMFVAFLMFITTINLMMLKSQSRNAYGDIRDANKTGSTVTQVKKDELQKIYDDLEKSYDKAKNRFYTLMGFSILFNFIYWISSLFV